MPFDDKSPQVPDTTAGPMNCFGTNKLYNSSVPQESFKSMDCGYSNNVWINPAGFQGKMSHHK